MYIRYTNYRPFLNLKQWESVRFHRKKRASAITKSDNTAVRTTIPTTPIPRDEGRASPALVNFRFRWEVSFLGTTSSAIIWSNFSVMSVSFWVAWQPHAHKHVDDEFRSIGAVTVGFGDTVVLERGTTVKVVVMAPVLYSASDHGEVGTGAGLSLVVIAFAELPLLFTAIQTESFPLVSCVTTIYQNIRFMFVVSPQFLSLLLYCCCRRPKMSC